jgi:uncharacterized membrane protein
MEIKMHIPMLPRPLTLKIGVCYLIVCESLFALGTLIFLSQSSQLPYTAYPAFARFVCSWTWGIYQGILWRNGDNLSFTEMVARTEPVWYATYGLCVVVALLALAFFLLMLWRGKNWARITLLCLLALDVARVFYLLVQPESESILQRSFVESLSWYPFIKIPGGILLLLPQTQRWFRGTSKSDAV